MVTKLLRKVLLLSLLISPSLLVNPSWASSIDEGIDYTVLPQAQPTETGDKIEVLEVFMYSCPHCFHLEPALERWLKKQPDSVQFRRMPAVFGPKVEPHARAFYAAELLGVNEIFDRALFDALHVKKKPVWREEDLVELAESVGIDAEAFRKAYNSFFVAMKVNRAKQMLERYGVDGVPTIIVNGKYRTSPSQTGSRARMFEAVDYLIQLESGEPAKAEGA